MSEHTTWLLSIVSVLVLFELLFSGAKHLTSNLGRGLFTLSIVICAIFLVRFGITHLV